LSLFWLTHLPLPKYARATKRTVYLTTTTPRNNNTQQTTNDFSILDALDRGLPLGLPADWVTAARLSAYDAARFQEGLRNAYLGTGKKARRLPNEAPLSIMR